MTYDGWLIVGLGNPGPSYAATRHNIGYLVADELASRMGVTLKRHKSGQAYAAEGRLGGMPGHRAVLGRARSYMNTSGGPVSGLMKFYSVDDPSRLIVIHDELDIPFGSVRLKLGGGTGGHNGLKSIKASIGSADFHRVRVGIGRPPGRMDTADFVLKPFGSTERADLPWLVQRAADAAEALVTDGLSQAQQEFHA